MVLRGSTLHSAILTLTFQKFNVFVRDMLKLFLNMMAQPMNNTVRVHLLGVFRKQLHIFIQTLLIAGRHPLLFHAIALIHTRHSH